MSNSEDLFGPASDDQSKALLDRHLRALREQEEARRRQANAESELLALARPEYESRCERDGVLHRHLTLSCSPPIQVSCDVTRHGIRVDTEAFRLLPAWLIEEGESYVVGVLPEELRSGREMQRLIELIGQELLTRCFDVRRDYHLPPEVLSHPACEEGAVQQHVAWLVASGLLPAESTIIGIDLRPEFAEGAGLVTLRRELPPAARNRITTEPRWRPPPGVESLRYDASFERRRAFQQLIDIGAVRCDLSVRVL